MAPKEQKTKEAKALAAANSGKGKVGLPVQSSQLARQCSRSSIAKELC